MLKQIEIQGQRFELVSVDGGRSWASDPRSVIAYRRRQERACEELRKRFELIDDSPSGPDPDYFCELEPLRELASW